MNNTSQEYEKVEKVLRKPVFCGFDEVSIKVKNHLLLFSIITIFIVLGGLHIQQDSSILGLKFSGLNDDIVYSGLFVIQIYLFIHFIWRSIDTFSEWLLRITGTKLTYITGSYFGSEEADYPDDPRQSTLYNWWSSKASQIGNLTSRIEELKVLSEKSILDINNFLDNKTDKSSLNPNVLPMLGELQKGKSESIQKLNEVNNSIKDAVKVIESKRVPVSLKRFDNAFQFFLRSQNLRWFIVDFLIPLLLGASSIILLATVLFI